MCTYDYTPYTGCGAGEQHYYIQWVKCNRAVEKGRYCSLDASVQAEQLRKLSANVLSCPLHGPVAVQQYVLEPANATALDHEENTRARSTSRRRNGASRSRTPGRSAAAREFEPLAPRRAVRQRRSRRGLAAESSDSESSSSLSPRSRTADRARRPAEHGLGISQNHTASHGNLHRRSSSADVALPPRPARSIQDGHSEASLPLKPTTTQADESHASTSGLQQAGTRPALDVPLPAGVVGLPSSPDMHRRSSVHRSRSEGLLRQSENGQVEPIQPIQPNTVSPSGDSSPDNNSELPFSMSTRRGRRPGPRSVRDRSVDTAMRRIDEDVVPEETDDVTRAALATKPAESRGSATTSPEPHRQVPDASISSQPASIPSHVPPGRRSGSRPRLDNLQIPKQGAQYQRDAHSAPTATPPETDITADHPMRPRTQSLRHVDITPTRLNDETSSLLSNRSRRFEDQVAEGRKWAAAREHVPPPAAVARGPTTDVLAHMSQLNLAPSSTSAAVPVAAGPRESVDSGYRSGHQPQRSSETVRSSPVEIGGAAATSVVGGGGAPGKGGRNTLQKSPPQQPQQQQQQQQGQAQGGKPRPLPQPLNLSGLPPCALPVSLVSPGFQSDVEAGSSGKGSKPSLRQRMGLKKKLSGLLWDRGGQREVGAVEG
ncbi:uncharacterized protein THITE_2117780 [Thermothielavioides terrestris NRRL 8126]|uniref:Uncharacterized protein n=1 Tax=Thermothielavioides terrestris (strain ATCC 38088 / NRRL 8126) TaxID=578455 RepID=G2R5M3_THETT|nr:uncharacterized protein THITE_2117780 [Thermothielavioides terrestris NRRL 8126]AEO68315.1 hypothetical protein THITE_2117780 [Thermothielavioides terrestris NRRL 8126]